MKSYICDLSSAQKQINNIIILLKVIQMSKMQWQKIGIKVCFVLIVVCFYVNGYGQKETYTWHFGADAGLSFKTNPPTSLTNVTFYAFEGCASISDTGGNMLFYTDGISAYNRNQDIMVNGTGLRGGSSSAQSAIIIPYPTRDSLYYIFTVSTINARPSGLHYSIVNMNLDTGNGGITSTKNVLLFNDTWEKLTAVKHGNGRDYWVIVQEFRSNNYRAYHVTDTGVVLPPVQSAVGASSGGQFMLKGNPQGTKVASTHFDNPPVLNVFDFNNRTGILSNAIALSTPGTCRELYSAEFSPNGQVLYANIYNCDRVLYQWNLNAGNASAINASRKLIDSGRATNTPFIGGMQLGPDGVIYIARFNQRYLSTILHPDALDTCCKFRVQGVTLASGTSTMGLPNFNPYFLRPAVPFDLFLSTTEACVGDTLFATATGDSIVSAKIIIGNQVDSGRTSTFVFRQPGIYDALLVTERNIVSSCNNSQRDTIRKRITVGQAKKVLPNDTLVCPKDYRIGISLNTSDYPFIKWSDTAFNENFLIITAPGQYIVELKDTNLCYFKDTITVTDYAFDPVVLSHDSLLCQNDTFSFSFSKPSNNYAYSIRFSDSIFNLNDTFAHFLLKDTGQISSVFYRKSSVCTDSISMSTRAIPLPLPIFELTVNPICFNNNTVTPRNLSDSLGYKITSLLWDWGDGNSDTSYFGNHRYSETDTFQVSLTLENIFGCVSTSTQSLYVAPNPSVDFSINDSIQCLKQQRFDLKAMVSISKGEISKLFWDLGANTFDSTSVISNLRYDSPGKYNIQLSAISDAGCSFSVLKRLYVKDNPVAILVADTLGQCLKGNRFTLVDSTTHDIPFKTYWEFARLGTTDSGKIITKHIAENGSYPFLQISIDSFGCADTLANTLTVYPQAHLSFDLDTVCLRDSIQLSAVGTVDGGTIADWKWVLQDADTFYQPRASYLYSMPGKYVASLFTQTDMLCLDTLVQGPVWVRPLPGPVAAAVGPVCSFDSLYFLNLSADTGQHSQSTYSVSWYGIQQEVRGNPFSLVPQDTGIQQATFIAENTFGCSDSSHFSFRVIPNPEAEFFFPFKLQCLKGNSFEPQNRSNGLGYELSYFWTFGNHQHFQTFEPIVSFPDTGFYPVTLTIQNAFGCTHTITDTLAIDFFPIPGISFTINNDSQCLLGNEFVFNNTSTIGSGSFETFIGISEIDTLSFGDTFSVSLTQPGLYTISVFINSDFQCKDTAYANIRVWEMPKSSFTSNQQVGCEGQSVFTFTNNTFAENTAWAYRWFYENNISQDSSGTIQYLFANAGEYVVSLESETPNQCRDTAIQTIVVNPVPVIQPNTNLTQQCINNQWYDFYANTSISSGTYQSSWNLPTLGIFNTDSLLRMRFDMLGTKTISFKATSDKGCADSTEFDIEIIPNPLAVFDLDTTLYCYNEHLILPQNNSSIVDGDIRYRWLINDSVISSEPSLEYRANQAGPFDLRLIAQSFLGCLDTFEMPITLYRNPVSAFNVLLIDSCFYTNEINVTSNALFYQNLLTQHFSLSDQQSFSEMPQFSYQFKTADTFIVTQTVSDIVGCSDTSFQYVIIRPQPKASILFDSINACLRNNMQSFTDQTDFDLFDYSRLWYVAENDTTREDSSFTYRFLNAGNQLVRLSVIGQWGCINSDSVTIEIWPKNDLDYSLSANSYCLKEQDLNFKYLGNTQVGDLNFLAWEWGDGTSSMGDVGTHRFSTPGLYNGQLVSQNTFDCFDTLAFSVEILANPSVNFALNDSVWCFNNQAIVATSLATLVNDSIVYTAWDWGDGSNSEGSTASKQYNIDGSFFVQHVARASNGCLDTATQQIHVFKNPIATVSANPQDLSSCLKGNQLHVIQESTLFQPISSVFWEIDAFNLQFLGDSIAFTLPTHGSFTLEMQVLDSIGCGDTLMTTIQIYPQSSLMVGVDTVCHLASTSIQSLSTIDQGEISSYIWDLGDGNTAQGPTLLHSYAKPGSYDIQLITTSDKGCKDTLLLEQSALVRPLPVAEFSYKKIFDSLQTTGFQFISNSNGVSELFHDWTFDRYGFSTEKNPYHLFVDSGRFNITLNVTDIYSCESSISKLIHVQPLNTIYVPNVFSPNNDHLNEVFKPYGMPYASHYRMEIYNRWGALLYVSHDINKGWDGTYQNKPVSPDIYLYKIQVIDMFGERTVWNGTVSLLR
jgi:gliding motility-associated-like protein